MGCVEEDVEYPGLITVFAVKQWGSALGGSLPLFESQNSEKTLES